MVSDEGLLAGILSGREEESFSEPIDWRALVRRAVDERVAPLLFWKLAEDARLPEGERNLLRSELYRAEASNLILYRELGRLLERSAGSGLNPPVLLKGGALASSLYEEIGHRPMGDIDVFIPREDLDRWLELAGKASFRRLSPEMSPGLDRAIHYHVALAGGTESEAAIEIHYGLIAGESDWRAPDPRWFLERTEEWRPPPSVLSTSSSPARQLDPTAHLLYLSAHAMLQHGGASARMIWFYDIHLLLSRWGGRVRWREALEQARVLQWDAALGAALERSRALFRTPLPAGLLEELAVEPPHRGARGAREVRRRRDPGRRLADVVWSELRSVGIGRGFLWALGILFPRPQYMRWRYPEAGRFWPTFYPVRWARVLWEGSRALLRKRPAG
jgi:hypothetical protein